MKTPFFSYLIVLTFASKVMMKEKRVKSKNAAEAKKDKTNYHFATSLICF